MKLFLDDVRFPPDESWTLVRDPSVCCGMILAHWGKIEAISLDHDLGPNAKNHKGEEMTGYDVVVFIEKMLFLGSVSRYDIPEIVVHSANPVGKANILAAVKKIEDTYLHPKAPLV